MGAADCLSQEKYQRAAKLVMIASAFAHFDTQRVADRSAHAALQAVFVETFADHPRAEVEAMYAEIQALSPGSEAHKFVCDALWSFGPPTYYPRYMINHGMAAFGGDNDEPLVGDFNPDHAWSGSLGGFVRREENQDQRG
jgi:hypothetical protein